MDQVRYVRIPPGMIGAVILGLRIDKGSEQRIKRWVEERAVGTELLRVQNVSDSFELEVVPA